MRATLQNPLTVSQGLNVTDPEVLRTANLTKPHQNYQVLSTLLPMFMVNICLYRHFLPACCFQQMISVAHIQTCGKSKTSKVVC